MLCTRVGKTLKNVALIPPSKFENFRELPSLDSQTFCQWIPSKLDPQPQKCYPHSHLEIWDFLRVALNHIFSRILEKPRLFKLYFSRNFEEFSKILKTIDLILTSKFEDFWGWDKNFLKIFKLLSPQKLSKFSKNATLNLKNSQTSRMRMRILVEWGLTCPP